MADQPAPLADLEKAERSAGEELERCKRAAVAAEATVAKLKEKHTAARQAYKAAASDKTWTPVRAAKNELERAEADHESAVERAHAAAEAHRAAQVPRLRAQRDIAKDAASLFTLTTALLPYIERLVWLESELCDTAISIVESVQKQHDALSVVDGLTKELGEPVLAAAFRPPESQPADIELIQRFVSVAIAQARNARRRVHTPDASLLVRYIAPPNDRSNQTEIDRWRQAEAALEVARTRASKAAAE